MCHVCEVPGGGSPIAGLPASAGSAADQIVACAAGKLLVNFDRGLAQTMAEAKALARMRVPLPEQARVVLLQEEKFQVYYDTLTHALQVGA